MSNIETRGRNSKYEPQEVYEILTNLGETVTTHALAEELDVCDATARKYIRVLRKAGFNILPTQDGQYLCTGDADDDAEKLGGTLGWLASMIIGLSTIGQVSIKMLSDRRVKKAIKELDPDSKELVSKNIATIKYLTDLSFLDEE